MKKMAQIIMMAKEYKCRPSEVIFIKDEYTAFCFDEVAFYLLNMVTDKEGNINWNKIRWSDNTKRSNKDFVNFLQNHNQLK